MTPPLSSCWFKSKKKIDRASKKPRIEYYLRLYQNKVITYLCSQCAQSGYYYCLFDSKKKQLCRSLESFKISEQWKRDQELMQFNHLYFDFNKKNIVLKWIFPIIFIYWITWNWESPGFKKEKNFNRILWLGL
jgi:hypothetical protein